MMNADQKQLADALLSVWNAIGPDAYVNDPHSSVDCGQACLDYLEIYGGLTREEVERLAPLATDAFLEELALGY
jgi:hypothetical protein